MTTKQETQRCRQRSKCHTNKDKPNCEYISPYIHTYIYINIVYNIGKLKNNKAINCNINNSEKSLPDAECFVITHYQRCMQVESSENYFSNLLEKNFNTNIYMDMYVQVCLCSYVQCMEITKSILFKVIRNLRVRKRMDS